ncbi:MAG: hypothetical protein [Caudoviricetes sp.]|nr:MAG: hypothetical protein [Caudoviricetes sp.]
MKTKNEIYVVVDTPKKAKKLQKVLDMFGERIERFTRESIEEYNAPWLEEKTPSVFYDSENKWIGEHAEFLEDKQKVSIKELLNILAVEHLKEGDVIVLGIGSTEYVVKYKKFDGNYFESIDYCMIGGSGNNHGSGCFDNFIRYATEEERILLEPKEEKLTKEDYKDNTWYKRENGGLFFLDKSKKQHYGFLCGSEWYEEIYWFENYELNGFDQVGTWKEATAEEVKEALIKEAEKRYKVGDKVSRICDQYYGNGNNILNDIFSMMEGGKLISITSNGYYHCIFKEGKLAEVLQQPDTQQQITDQDIATLERLHDTLHDVHGYSLEFELIKSARVLSEKLRELNTKNK